MTETKETAGTPGATPFERLGGTPALQSLLRHFYADVRQEVVLGPIFNARIPDWPAHLIKIESFWARQLGGPSDYAGGFAAAHLPLGLEPTHFDRWLRLWERNCRQHLDAASADWMIGRAQDIATHLRRLVAGEAGLRLGG